jgi:hypothetical protein
VLVLAKLALRFSGWVGTYLAVGARVMVASSRKTEGPGLLLTISPAPHEGLGFASDSASVRRMWAPSG